jgi:uncharacterized phage protein gp47/JayE
MSVLSLRTFDDLVGTMAGAVQGACSQLVDLTIGSVLRVVLEANASVALWMQWLILCVLQTTRAATSTGGDLDSWVGDFGVSRLPGVAAAGAVTFARFTPTIAALVPVGALVRSLDGTQTFAVLSDVTNTAWSAAQNGYLIAAGTATVSVPVQAQAIGQAGNVQIGAIAQLVSAMPGVDTVGNAAPMVGGADAETDAALRARFAGFLDSRNRATPLAVANAILSVRQGLTYAISQNVDPAGMPRMGFFTITLNDGTGSPPSALLTAVAAAVDPVRPIGTSFAVVAPQLVPVTVTMQVSVVPTVAADVVDAAVEAALVAFIDGLAIGAPLPISRLAQVAYDTDAAITNVTNVMVNGGRGDLTVAPTALVTVASVVVT